MREGTGSAEAGSEDAVEAQSSSRQRVWTTPAGVTLGGLDAIADPGSRGYVLQIGEAFFHGFVVRRNGETAGWVDRCPHAGFPIAIEMDRYLTPDGSLILCGWHGAVFDPIGGKCLGGPCAGGALTPWPVRVEEGLLKTA